MQLTFDVFSGRANPSWQLPSLVAGRIFSLIADSGFLKLPALRPFPPRLGYRGLELRLPVDIGIRYRVPPLFRLPADPNPLNDLSILRELESIARFAGFFGGADFLRLLRLIIEFLQRTASRPGGGSPGGGAGGGCPFEMLPFDPNPWNDPAFKPTNNCYAYASNKRDRYPRKPQPGLGSGAMFSSLTGPDVADAAKRDGAHDAGDCFPDSEAPRLLVALVIWPGEDYHWYRKHPDCWGHKPGATDARNVDNAGAVIANPETCDRGPYTVFHCYMLIPKSQKVAA